MSTATDVNRTIDHGIAAFTTAAESLRDVIIEPHPTREERELALKVLAALELSYHRMAGLARLSVTPFDQERD